MNSWNIKVIAEILERDKSSIVIQVLKLLDARITINLNEELPTKMPTYLSPYLLGCFNQQVCCVSCV